MGGGRDESLPKPVKNNVDTIYLKFTATAEPALLKEFRCEFKYFKTGGDSTVVTFTQSK